MHRPWFQLGASLVAMIMIANLQYAWTLFVLPLQNDHGWTLADIQWAFTLFVLFQTWVQPLDGWLIDKLGPRRFITLAGVLSGLGWASLAYASSIPQLYVLYATAGVGAALVYSGSIGSALKWFSDRRGLASGIIAAGFGGGTALFIPIIRYLIDNQGYRAAFLWTGIFQGLVIVIVAQFLRHPAGGVAPAAKAAAARPGRSRRNAEQFTTAEMLRTPHFYLLYLMFVMMSTGGLLATAQAGPVAQAFGLPLAALTVALTLSPIANGASRIFWGWVSDRLGREQTMAVAFFLQALCLLGVLTLGRSSGTWFTITLALTFFTWGEIFSLFPSTCGDWFGTRHATSNYAFLYTAKGVSSILAGGVAAMLFQQFGSWSAAFYGSAALAFIAGVMAVGLRLSPLPKKAVARSIEAASAAADSAATRRS
ncbi:MAG TPA: oxalate/formate MFS antiporter [Vicinamibacterales bacterium]|nr:oxalate/formate MFS antiporter [Vicinamibacterales bacterium]